MIQHTKISNNKQDSNGYTGLSLADQIGLTEIGLTEIGLTEIGEKVLEFDEILVDTAEQRVKQTALMLTAARNHRETVRFLLRRGAKPKDYQ
jgi:ankyrin repeat protein